MRDSRTDPRFCRRALVVAAHPDDEILGLGTALPMFTECMIVHVTDGAPLDLLDASAHGFSSRQAYARARHDELEAALEIAGIRPQLHSLGVVDQRTCWEIPRITEELNRIITAFQPEVIWTHPYEGGHPDHDVCALCVHAVESRPLAEFTSYHAGPHGIVTGEFLPPVDGVITHELTQEERERKSQMLACFQTQRETIAQFRLDVERYRWAPHYNFEAAPHVGRLFYENFPWGLTGERFRELARSFSHPVGQRELV